MANPGTNLSRLKDEATANRRCSLHDPSRSCKTYYGLHQGSLSDTNLETNVTPASIYLGSACTCSHEATLDN